MTWRLCRRFVVGLGLLVAAGAALAQIPPPAAPQQGAPPPQTPPVTPAAPPPPARVEPAPVPPTVTLPSEVLDPIKRLTENIESAEKSIQQLKELEGELQRLRTDVERIIYDSTAAAEGLRPQLAEVKDQIEKLGPPPGKDQPPESVTVAAERARLNSLAGALDSAVKTSVLAWVRAKQLIDRITVMRYALFTRNLFERRQSPVFPAVWRDVGERMPTVVSRLEYYGGDWLGWARRKSTELTLLAIALVAIYGLGTLALGRFLAARLVRPEPPPPFFERAIKAAWIAPARMLAPVVCTLIAYSALDSMDLLFAPWDGPAGAMLRGLLVYVAASALLAVTLAPRHPAWRLIPVTDATAWRLLAFLRAFIAVYVIDTVLIEFGRVLYVPLVVTIAQSFLTSLLFAGLLVGLLATRFEPQSGADRPVNGGHEYSTATVSLLSPLWVKMPLWLIAALIVGTSMFGFIALARYIAHQLVLSGIVLGAVGLLYLSIRAVTRGRSDGTHPLGTFLGQRFGIDPQRQTQLARLIEFALTFALLLAALPVLLLQWGFTGADVRDWAKALLFGFEIGQFRISLARILIGIVLFIGLLFATRLVQRWLRDRVLAQSRMDSGIANSIDTAVGYGGIALAALLSVSYAGFDITSLAIVAGALSVGIGFGLQSIVNNFVSGLILLVERPIKVGDWIVVGSDQGNVRRISVRSTEIETFDRASLIVPNSELIAGRVLNWTHRNLLGRFVLKVATDANADPDQVLALLKRVAQENILVLRQPEPSAMLDAFAADRLDFSLRVTLGDVNSGGSVQSQLRVAIFNAFRDAGLLVPTVPAVGATPPPVAIERPHAAKVEAKRS